MRIIHLSLPQIHASHLARLLECLRQQPGNRELRSDVHVQSQILAKAVDLALVTIALAEDEAKGSAPDDAGRSETNDSDAATNRGDR